MELVTGQIPPYQQGLSTVDVENTIRAVQQDLQRLISTEGLDEELAAIAGLVSAADKLPYFTGAGTAALTTFTTAGRALVDDANATAQIATLGLDADIATFALPASTTISAFGATIVDDANAAAVIITLGLDADLATFVLPANTTISAYGASLVDDAAAANARVTLGLPVAGSIVQVVNTQTGAVATGTTAIPQDDTIPQNTEGDQYMSLAITPTSATNKLKIDVVFVGTYSATAKLVVALFQDTTASALACTGFYAGVTTHPGVCSFSHYMTAGTTSATTFKVRAGGVTGVTETLTFNGAASARFYGGVLASSITIQEIQV